MALWLVRHGSTALNAETPGVEKLRGWQDVPLATSGVIIARSVGRFLQPFDISRLYTSDLSRAKDSARIMSVTLALAIEPSRDLRPWNTGDYAGQDVNTVKPRIDALRNGHRNDAPPNGESFNAFLDRWTVMLKHLLMESQYEDVAAVTHGSNLYALSEILFKEPIPVKGPPHPGSVTRLEGLFGKVSAQTMFPGYRGKESMS